MSLCSDPGYHDHGCAVTVFERIADDLGALRNALQSTTGSITLDYQGLVVAIASEMSLPRDEAEAVVQRIIYRALK